MSTKKPPTIPDASEAVLLENSFFGREITYNGKHYTVNQFKADRFTVWAEGAELPYTVLIRPYYCTCPDWNLRRKKYGSPCKHHHIVQLFLKGESTYTPPSRSDLQDPYSLNYPDEEDDEEIIIL